MISRQTIFSLLLALLIAAGIRAWSAEHIDDCDRLGAGRSGTPVWVNVRTGSRIVAMPCSYWILRQPFWLHMVCLADGAFGMVFLLSGWADARRSHERRELE